LALVVLVQLVTIPRVLLAETQFLLAFFRLMLVAVDLHQAQQVVVVVAAAALMQLEHGEALGQTHQQVVAIPQEQMAYFGAAQGVVLMALVTMDILAEVVVVVQTYRPLLVELLCGVVVLAVLGPMAVLGLLEVLEAAAAVEVAAEMAALVVAVKFAFGQLGDNHAKS
jgi:hypothetical protein